VITKHVSPELQRWTLYFTTLGELLAFQDKLNAMLLHRRGVRCL
jgi:hypothetical protein